MKLEYKHPRSVDVLAKDDEVATNLDSHPTATTMDVEDLVESAWRGQLRIPHFQRDFKWAWQDMQKLFDSIVKGYPIGSLLLWTRPAEQQRVKLGALDIDAPQMSEALWVVDGQQRLTALANTLHPQGYKDSRFAMAYDLRDGSFVRPPSSENPLIVPMPVLFDLEQLLDWFSKFQGMGEYVRAANAVTRKLRQFEVPAYLVSTNDQQVLQDIFDRMNNYGKRLSRPEIFAALNAGSEEVHESDELSFEHISDNIDGATSFGQIDNETVLSAILARRGPEVRRDIRNEFSAKDDEGKDAAYRAGEEALRKAVNFLQTQAFVPHISMLSYRYLLVVLARVFAFFPDLDARNRRLLRRWFWQASAVGPEVVRGGTPNAARILCGRVIPGDPSGSVQGLLRTVQDTHPRRLDLTRFATNEAATKILLCAWWAQEPRRPSDGQSYDQTSLAAVLEDHLTARDAIQYVLPRRRVPHDMRSWAANRVLMPDAISPLDEVAELLQQSPSQSGDQWLRVLDSHSLTVEMVDLAMSERWSPFLQLRQDFLATRMAAFMSRVCEWDFENTPPLSDLDLDDEDDDEGGAEDAQ